MNRNSDQSGFALVTVLMLLALLMSLVLGYFTMTRIETSTTRSSMDSIRGFYAAEAGLNLRAEQVRQIFTGYNRPSGTSPSLVVTDPPCTGSNNGTGDLACVKYSLQQRKTATYIEEPPGNPETVVIPRGEPFQNLTAQEYRYDVYSQAIGFAGRPEAVLQMRFKSRLVPLFQFAVFYNKDLEILPGPDMSLAGPVHTNGDLYLGTHNTLDIIGQVTTAGDLYRGRKYSDSCMAGPVQIADPEFQTEIPVCSGSRRHITQAEVDPWNGMIQTDVDSLAVPPPEALDPVPGATYWDSADIRVMLDLDATPAIEVRLADGTVDALDTAVLLTCGAVSYSNTLYNNREGAMIQMLDVDMRAMMDCLHLNPLMGIGKDLDETSEGGLVWYFGVEGPDDAGLNSYGVRLRNGAELASGEITAPDIKGLTVVSGQSAYVQGDYNAVNKKPAAVLADSINILSNNWSDANSPLSLNSRIAANTTVNSAFLAGTDSTGAVEGGAGQDLGNYNGGLENYPRFHEKWSGYTLTYLGSFVSLNTPRHVDGNWIYGAPQYTAPNRAWGYDTDFDSAEKLPPLSPRFVYLRQDLFVRQFEL